MSAVRVFSRQRARAVDRRRLGLMTRCLVKELLAQERFHLAVHLIDSAEMARLNETFLGHEGSTDVIAFNHLEDSSSAALCGEIFISVPDAVDYARKFRTAWQAEIVRYVVHGVLHLAGCDDLKPGPRRAMKRRENGLLKELSQRFDLGKLQASGHARK